MHFALDLFGFSCREISNRVIKLIIIHVMRRIGENRRIAALNLMQTLRSCLNPGKAMADSVIDRLIITGFKMQKGDIDHAPPVAAI